MLADEAIERYARQIVIPGIGAEGQQKLLASRVAVLGSERGCEQAACYLRAAGVRVVESLSPDDGAVIDVVLIADVGAIEEATIATILALAKPVCWYALDDHGFTSGVHPEAPLPSPQAASAKFPAEFHDAAACDTAAIACAIILGLAWRSGPLHFDC